MKTKISLLISTVLTLFTFCYSSDSSDEIKDLYYDAERNYASRDYDSAIDSYGKAFEKSQKGSENINKKFNTLMRYKTALSFVKQGDYESAWKHISDLGKTPRVYDGKAYREGINYLWLYSLYMDEQYRNVSTKFEISKFKKSKFKNDALYIIGDSNLRLRKYGEARKAFIELKGQYGEEGKYRAANCLLNMGVEFLNKKQDAVAGQQLKEAFNQYEEFINAYKNKENQFMAAAYFDRGIIHLIDKKYSDARQDFDLALQLALQESGRNPEKYQQMVHKTESIISDIDSDANKDRIWKLAESGDSLFEKRDYRAAAMKYAEAWENSPDQQEFLKIRLYAKCREGLSYFRAAKAPDKDMAFDEDLVERSISAYEQAIEDFGDENKYKDFDFPERSQYVEKAQIQLAYVLCKVREFSRSADLFDQIESDDAKYHAGYCHYQAEASRKHNGKPKNDDEAEESANEESKENLENAINAFVQVLEKYPLSTYAPHAYYGMILAYRDLAKAAERHNEERKVYDEAKENIEKFKNAESKVADQDVQKAIKIMEQDINYTLGEFDELFKKLVAELRQITTSNEADETEKKRAQMKIAHLQLLEAMGKGEPTTNAIPGYANQLTKSEKIAKYQILVCHYKTGEKAEYNDNTEEMKEHYKEALKSVNDLLKSRLDKAMELRVYYMLGMAAYRLDDNDMVIGVLKTRDSKDIAIKAFEKVKELERNGDSEYVYNARYKLARLYADRRQYEMATSEYNHIIQRRKTRDTPMDWYWYRMLEAYYGLAYCYDRKGDEKKCRDSARNVLDYHEKLSEIDPETGKSFYNGVLNKKQAKDKDNMVLHSRIMSATSPEEITEIEPGDPNISLYRRLQSYYVKGILYYERAKKQSDIEKRRADYRKSLDQFLKFRQIPISNNKAIEDMQTGEERKKAIEEHMSPEEKQLVQDSLYRAGFPAFGIGEGEHWDRTVSALEDYIKYTDSGLFGDTEKNSNLRKQRQQVLYFLGDGYLNTGQDHKAAGKFKYLLDQCPSAEDKAHWQYKIGNSYYNNAKRHDIINKQKALDNYKSASTEFGNVLKNHPKHESADKAMYKKLLCEKMPVSIDDSVAQIQSALDNSTISEKLRQEFSDDEMQLSGNATVVIEEDGSTWLIADERTYYAIRKEEGTLNIYKESEYYSLAGKLVIEYPQSEHAPTCINLLYEAADQQYNRRGAGLYSQGSIPKAMDMYKFAIDALGTILISKITIDNGSEQDLRDRVSNRLLEPIRNLAIAIHVVNDRPSSKFIVDTLETLATKGANEGIRKRALDSLNSLARRDAETDDTYLSRLPEELLATLRRLATEAANRAADRVKMIAEISAEISRLEANAKGLLDDIDLSQALRRLVDLQSEIEAPDGIPDEEIKKYEELKDAARQAAARARDYSKRIDEISGLEHYAKKRDDQALDRLTKLAVEHPDNDVRDAAKKASARVQEFRKCLEDINRLKILARSTDKNVRQQALDDLKKLANDHSDEDVRAAAREALGEIKSDEAKKGEPEEGKEGIDKSEASKKEEPQEKDEENEPIIIIAEELGKLQLPSLLHREKLLGLISPKNYNRILDGKKPLPEDMLDMSLTWWYGVSIWTSLPLPYVADIPEIQMPQIDKPEPPSELMWNLHSTELPDRTEELYELGKWKKRKKWLRWKSRWDVGLAVAATATVIYLNTRPQREEGFSDWPDGAPNPPRCWTGYAIGKLEYGDPPPFPSEKISPKEWRERNISMWYPTPRIETYKIRTPAGWGRDGCFVIDGVFIGTAIYRWFNRKIIFPPVAE